MDKQSRGPQLDGPRTILHLEPVTVCGRVSSHSACPWGRRNGPLLLVCEAPVLDYQQCLQKEEDEDE